MLGQAAHGNRCRDGAVARAAVTDRGRQRDDWNLRSARAKHRVDRGAFGGVHQRDTHAERNDGIDGIGRHSCIGERGLNGVHDSLAVCLRINAERVRAETLTCAKSSQFSKRNGTARRCGIHRFKHQETTALARHAAFGIGGIRANHARRVFASRGGSESLGVMLTHHAHQVGLTFSATRDTCIRIAATDHAH